MKENFEQEFKKDGIEQIKELLGSLENSSKEQELLVDKLEANKKQFELNIQNTLNELSRIDNSRLDEVFSGYGKEDQERIINDLVDNALNQPSATSDEVIKSLFEYASNIKLLGDSSSLEDSEKEETLFRDTSGELISFPSHLIKTDEKGKKSFGSTDLYTVLTGPEKGKKFSSEERPIFSEHAFVKKGNKTLQKIQKIFGF